MTAIFAVIFWDFLSDILAFCIGFFVGIYFCISARAD